MATQTAIPRTKSPIPEPVDADAVPQADGAAPTVIRSRLWTPPSNLRTPYPSPSRQRPKPKSRFPAPTASRHVLRRASESKRVG